MPRAHDAVVILTLVATASAQYCAKGTAAQCNETQLCPSIVPYQCNWFNPAAHHANYSCQATPWGNCEGSCFDTRLCKTYSCPPCRNTSRGCGECGYGDSFYCDEGPLDGHCSPTDTLFINTTQCTNCCNAIACHVCPPCTPEQCQNHTCDAVEVCLITGGCANQHVWPTPECPSCCDKRSCPTPAPPPPRPASPWDLVPWPTNCNRSELPAMSPDPGPTRWGGADVSNARCRAEVTSDSCCGYVPRFNWVLSTCHADEAKRNTMACTHAGASESKMRLNYVAAYQFDGTAWVRDPQASFELGGNITEWYVGGGWPNDWDLKYGPQTDSKGTHGVGPPGMMFVMSADAFAWSAFYALNQITINRGPGGEIMADNCWSSSSGEFDFVESPFWADVVIPFDRLYFTTTADSGRCIPTAKSVPPSFHRECSDATCCLACNCNAASGAPVCFGNASNIGYTTMACTALNGTIPPDNAVFTLDGSNTSCSNHSGSIGGGADSSSYFVQPEISGEVPMIYAAIIDRDGTTVYRWPADRDEVWPGLYHYSADERLAHLRPVTMSFATPCETTEPCGIHQPSCAGDCPVIEAGGVFGLDSEAGSYAVEAAKDGQNWWNLFNSTGQLDGRITAGDLPFYAPVPHFTPPLPFYCNGSCGAALCANESCSVNATYMCTAGDGYMGCASSATHWPTSGKCGSCCDVTSCYFNCPPCDAFSAAVFCGGCNPSAPYVCTSGPAAGGCGTQKTWGTTPNSCGSCCQCPLTVAPTLMGTSADREPALDADDDAVGWWCAGLLVAIGVTLLVARRRRAGVSPSPSHKDAWCEVA